MAKKGTKGLSAEKDEFSEWFSQIMLKADLADYSSVSGCMVFKPKSYEIWETIKGEVDKRFKKIGIKNVYFPLFIPEKLLNKEKEHVQGFSPEVAWVTEAGDSKLSERLAVRPTSEAIMYDSYAKWIRSWRDLPLLYNQWNNVVRWEFRHPVPFLRTREFLWNEGHTAYADKKNAEAEGKRIIGIYKEVCENFMALPALIGRKTEKEKFAGADYTVSMEYYMPNGKAIQGPDFHHDGDNFAKAYGIQFLDKDGEKKYVQQNTFAISTRMLGVMFAVHSDKNGLVLPPKIVLNKAVIVPILFEDSKKKVLDEARKMEGKLKKYGAVLDDREGYNPGHKFAEWELKGIPLRIEIGPKDLAKKEVVVYRRDTGKKQNVKTKDLDKYVGKMLEEIQDNLFKKAKKLLYNNIEEKIDLKGVEYSIHNKRIAFSPLCKKRECENELKHKSGGGKVLNISDSQPGKLKTSKCVVCNGKAEYFAYIGRSY
jgi:prolyl-tRNA synthetase